MGVLLLNTVILKLKDSDTPEHLIPKGNAVTSKAKIVDVMIAVKIENKAIEIITQTMLPDSNI
jgi:hypothetical protein